MKYHQLVLKKGREKSVLNQHPWIFSGAVYRKPEGNDPFVHILDFKGNHLAIAFYDPASQIIARIFHFGEPLEIDQSFWSVKVKAAFQLRQSLINDQTTGYRLINAEGDGLPGIIADVYERVVSLKLTIPAVYHLESILIDQLRTFGPTSFYIDTANYKKWVDTPAEKNVLFQENQLKFIADSEHGQKTGFFLDQRDNRQLVQSVAEGKTVLNAFCYSGAFSVYAIAGGAIAVDSVDVSQGALNLTEKNLSLNFSPSVLHQSIVADCFDYLRSMQSAHYDLIILDPPAFAKSKRAVVKASRGYKDINLQAFSKIRPAGLVFTFSCSQHISADLFQKIIFAAAKDSGRSVKILKKLGQAQDHPVNIFHPEGEYLKGLLLYVT